MERNLVVQEKVKKVQSFQAETEKYERTCECHKQKNSKPSDIAKHYLYHKPNPKLKWQVQSLTVENQRSLQRRDTII